MAICREGQKVSPRGIDTVEMLHGQLVSVDLSRAVVTSPARKLSAQFMAAEALWIVNGQNDLASLARFAPSYGRFSDDGVTLNGAYGPKVRAQTPYVVQQLSKDRDTRQAVLTIWERNPLPSKDIPCTVAMSFSIRRDLLHLHVFMRSSDGWMGLPYDMFSFATVALFVACMHNWGLPRELTVGLGTMTINATSSHLYLKDIDKVKEVLESDPGPVPEPTPDALVRKGDWETLRRDLMALREGTADETCQWRPLP
jgi:thymidylate synthase